MYPLKKTHTDVRESNNQKLDAFLLEQIEKRGPVTSYQLANLAKLFELTSDRRALERGLQRLKSKRLVIWGREDGWRKAAAE